MTRADRAKAFLRHLGPAMPRARPAELAGGSLGALLGIGLAAAVALALGRGDLGLYLIAPFGASAVLLFAVPNSPLAQPWSAIAGNTVSAIAALAVVQVMPDGGAAAAVAVGLAILAMHLARALHPPGGAVALVAALQPEAVRALGWHFPVAPVLAGTAFLVGVAMLYAPLAGRRYPFRQPADVNARGTTDSPALDRLGVSRVELAGLLRDFRQSANIGVEDLARLIGAAEMLAAQHHLSGTAAEIMSRDLVTVGPEAPLAEVAAIFGRHGFTSLPVVGAGADYLGVIFQIHLVRNGVAAAGPRRWWRRPAVRAADIMATGLPAAAPETPVAELMPLLADGTCDAVPVLEQGRIVGIVTQTDLIAALTHLHAEADPAIAARPR